MNPSSSRKTPLKPGDVVSNFSRDYRYNSMSESEYITKLENEVQLLRNKLEEIVNAANDSRLRLSQEYANNLNNNESPMYGNMDWARLEGAVAVNSAIRKIYNK